MAEPDYLDGHEDSRSERDRHGLRRHHEGVVLATLIIFTRLASGADCRAETIATMPMLQCNVMWQMEAARLLSRPDHVGRMFSRYECLAGTGGA